MAFRSRRAFSGVCPLEIRNFSPAEVEDRTFSGTNGNWNAPMYHDFSPCVLVTIALTNASGCGTDTAVTVSSKSGRSAATCHATAAPQSWPTRCTLPTASASISATVSAASSDPRYAQRAFGLAPGEYPR